jgi:hypothetical protein
VSDKIAFDANVMKKVQTVYSGISSNPFKQDLSSADGRQLPKNPRKFMKREGHCDLSFWVGLDSLNHYFGGIGGCSWLSL